MKVSLVLLLATTREVWATGDDDSRSSKRQLNGYYPAQSPSYYQPYYKTPYPTHTPPTPYPTGRRPTPMPTPYPVPRPTPMPTPHPTQGSDPYYPQPYYPDPYYPPPPPPPVRTPMPTPNPTKNPTPDPTAVPTYKPTPMPTLEPTNQPTAKPTSPPTATPTSSPTANPTSSPTAAPTPRPTPPPTPQPTFRPTAPPTPVPTATPTDSPSESPTDSPSESPTDSEEPSESPTDSEEPSESPTDSEEPSESPTDGDPTIYEIICDPDNFNTYGLLCTFVTLFPDVVILLGGTNGQINRAQIIARANAILGGGRRELQIQINNNTPATNLGLIAQFLDLGAGGAGGVFDDEDITLFAPTNSAFITMPNDVLADIVGPNGQDRLYEILLTHVYEPTAVPFRRLFCGTGLIMASNQETLTRCRNGFKFQVGLGNAPDREAEIVGRDEEASNGVIHTIDEVILPALSEFPSSAPSISSEPSSGPSE
eukprot:CAMPEP_0116131678 /NCGR_PEP_ID=MMETSP0329-20121206/9138_1 /TAXON_ID=697910 /ORGANISM="Pseudo-nitzschia arenysensis, Strain B593" /LENGTH=480 /DNA_ID=CAMNT_0003626133 /DNA_START=92 /DNA_END=1531 /DNA_ORIENTATION=-